MLLHFHINTEQAGWGTALDSLCFIIGDYADGLSAENRDTIRSWLDNPHGREAPAQIAYEHEFNRVIINFFGGAANVVVPGEETLQLHATVNDRQVNLSLDPESVVGFFSLKNLLRHGITLEDEI